MGSISDPSGQSRAGGEENTIPNPKRPRELLGPDESFEEFFRIARNASEEPENPRTWQALEEVLEKTDWEKVRERLACPMEPPCTDLLTDPAGVLRDEKRWPNHLCPGRFLARSTKTWASPIVELSSTPGAWRWRTQWPLPIGKRALDLDTLQAYGLVPFEGREKALWAIRIKAADCTLDLFALGRLYGHRGHRREEVVYKLGELRTIYGHRPEEVDYEPGELRSILSGRCASLSDLLPRAERLWAQIRGQKITGRPRGSGTWRSTDDFRKVLSVAVRTLRAEGRKVTQENIAAVLCCDDRTLRKWFSHFGIRWEDVKKTP